MRIQSLGKAVEWAEVTSHEEMNKKDEILEFELSPLVWPVESKKKKKKILCCMVLIKDSILRMLP